jgi:trans-aconitate methyltransferase
MQPTVLVTNAGSGTEMEAATICGLNVVGVDSSHAMFSCAAKRLQRVQEAQKARLTLARLAASKPEDYIQAAIINLPTSHLTSPEKRRRAVFQESMPGLDVLYHGVMGVQWHKEIKSRRMSLLTASLKVYIM